jgi:hypothetical protein
MNAIGAYKLMGRKLMKKNSQLFKQIQGKQKISQTTHFSLQTNRLEEFKYLKIAFVNGSTKTLF